MKNKHILSLLVLLSLAISACAPGAVSTPDQAVEAQPLETQNVELTPTQMEESLPETGSTEEPAQTPAPSDIVDIASADGRFTTLVAAVQEAGLVEALKSEGPFTVFAPTDDAFSKLPEGTLEELLMPENSDMLENILLYHVVEGKVMAEDVVMLEEAETLAGQAVKIEVMDDEVMINDAKVIITDIEASNGVIHVIDTVLLPAEETADTGSLDIVDTAIADGRFTTLVAAVEAAGLVDALKAEGPFTVFAPTDEAFSKLPEGTVEELLKPENQEKLQQILLYHVVEGKVTSADVANLDTANTLADLPLSIQVDSGTVKINDAQVVITDIETSNGIIHVIDTVLLP